MEKIIALVPMRHHSQRVSGKNYRLLANKPLYSHIISTLLQCTEIAQIVVDTDSSLIKEGLKEKFPEVYVLDRPEHLRDDGVPMNDVLLNDVEQFEADLFLQTHSTNPLLRPDTLSTAIQTMLDVYPEYDSLFSVTRLQSRLWDRTGKAINHDPSVLLQTQDLPAVYEENSCIYIFTKKSLKRYRNRIGKRPYMFEINSMEAWDIDDELDFRIAEHLMKHG